MYRENYHNLRIEKQDFREAGDRKRRDYEREISGLRERLFDLEGKNADLKQRLNGFTLNNEQVKELLRRIEKLEKMAK